MQGQTTDEAPTNACQKRLTLMCGCIRGIRMPAGSARCLSRRVAACRSIRTPMVLRRIGAADAADVSRHAVGCGAASVGKRVDGVVELVELMSWSRTTYSCSMSIPPGAKRRARGE